ncbi:MAG: hypothetical protein KDC70_00240 [Saprospiraceae bacterium]|nr:hypothetical protein [Saprospiraceae bacterium]
MRKLKSIAEDVVLVFFAVMLSTAAQAQPWSAGEMDCCQLRTAIYGTPPSLVELAKPDPDYETNVRVLGLFKNETQAATWLTAGGSLALITGAYLQGRAAYSIQVHGHSRDWDAYEITRTTGLSLQIIGGATYGAGFAYRSKRWYKRRPVLFGALEAAVWAVGSHYISQYGYNQRKGE